MKWKKRMPMSKRFEEAVTMKEIRGKVCHDEGDLRTRREQNNTRITGLQKYAGKNSKRVVGLEYRLSFSDLTFEPARKACN